jgi:hypothetical protein
MLNLGLISGAFGPRIKRDRHGRLVDDDLSCFLRIASTSL